MVSSVRTDSHSYKKTKNPNINNRIIAGNFGINNDFKALLILKLNSVLGSLLVITILVSMVSYSMVIAKENVLASINNKTSDLSYENLDLQTKVDNAKSLYTINKKAAKINFLKKADKVLEVKNLAPVLVSSKNETKIQPVVGY